MTRKYPTQEVRERSSVFIGYKNGPVHKCVCVGGGVGTYIVTTATATIQSYVVHHLPVLYSMMHKETNFFKVGVTSKN